MNPDPAPHAGSRDPVTGMRYAQFVERVAGEGSRAWDIHYRARDLEAAGRDVIVLSVGEESGLTSRALL